MPCQHDSHKNIIHFQFKRDERGKKSPGFQHGNKDKNRTPLDGRSWSPPQCLQHLQVVFFSIRNEKQDYYTGIAKYQIRVNTRQNIATPVNRTLVMMVTGKQPRVVPLLNHNKSYRRLVVGLQRCTSLEVGNRLLAITTKIVQSC